MQRIEDLAKAELAESRKPGPDAYPTSLLPSSCIEDTVTVYLNQGFESAFVSVIANYNSLPITMAMRKSVNLLQVPYMIKDAIQLIESQG